MKTYRAIKYEIAPTAAQRETLKRMLGCTRFVWNKLLALSVTRYELERKFIISVLELNSTLNCLKREFEFLCEAPSQALQQVYFQQQKALRDFLTHRKTDHHFGFPKFHRKHNGDSFSIPVPCHVDFENWKVKLPKIGTVKIFKGSNKAIPVKQIKRYTVSYTPTGRFYVSIIYSINKEGIPNNGKAVGIDLGIKHYCVTSEGEVFENQKYLSRNLKRLRVMQRSLSRKYKVGKKREEQSNNWKKTMKKVCKLYEKIGFQRKDFLHKLSTYLAKKYHTVCAETLSVKNMVKNRKLSRVISDAGWSMFLSMLNYKCGNFVEIDRFYPSSQTCSVCKEVNPKVKNLSVRSWVCPNCNTFHDRDLNAAKNILREGLSLCEHKVSQKTMPAPRTPRL